MPIHCQSTNVNTAGPLIGRRDELRDNAFHEHHAVSSSVARYSLTARLDLFGIVPPPPVPQPCNRRLPPP